MNVPSPVHPKVPSDMELSVNPDLIDLKIIPLSEAQHLERHKSPKFELQVPAGWKPPVQINAHAEEIGEKTIAWISGLGCENWQIRRLIDFQSSHYVGIPFPITVAEKALSISKYLSLWLLWDDVEIESGNNRWRIESSDVLAKTPPPQSTIYDLGWYALLQEMSPGMSGTWLQSLIQAMFTWDQAARHEAQVSRSYRERHHVPSFADSLLTRISTIGMYATAHLVEYANSLELPPEFHRNPIVQRMKTLSNLIVGLGNEIFSFAKDYADDFINVIVVLAAEEGLPLVDTFAKIIQLHNDTMREYDELERRLLKDQTHWNASIKEWAQQMRYCSLGFSIWESQAPRYNKMKILAGDRILEPTIVYV